MTYGSVKVPIGTAQVNFSVLRFFHRHPYDNASRFDLTPTGDNPPNGAIYITPQDQNPAPPCWGMGAPCGLIADADMFKKIRPCWFAFGLTA